MAEAGSLSNLYIENDIGRHVWDMSSAGMVEPPATMLEEQLACSEAENRDLRAALADTIDELRQLRRVTLRKQIAFSGESSGGKDDTGDVRTGYDTGGYGAGDGLAATAGASSSLSLFGAGGLLSFGGRSTPSPYATCTTTSTYVYNSACAIVSAVASGTALGRGRSMTPIQAAAPFPSTVGIGPASIGTTTGHIAGYHYGGTIPAVAQTFANSLGSDNGVGAGIAGTYTQTWNGLVNPFLSNTYVTNGCFSTPAAPVTSRGSDTSMPIPSATAVSSIYGTALAPHVAGPGLVNIGDDEGYRQRTPWS
jgi:hypothetical protein